MVFVRRVLGIDFCRFLEALGAAFLVFGALKTDLKIEGFECGHGPREVELGTLINVRFEPSKDIKA